MELLKNKNILYELVRKSVKTQYRGSWLGMVWVVLNPLLTTLVMWIIFSQFLKNRDDLFVLYLFTGNIVFGALRSGTDQGLSSIVNNRGLLSRIKIDPYLFPLSSAIASIVNMLFSCIALLLIMGILAIVLHLPIFNVRMLFSFLMLPALLLFIYGIGLFLSVLYIFARDLKHLYNVLLLLWMYITPIFYKIDMVGSGSIAQQVIKLNPMYYFVRFFRDSIYMGWSEYPAQDLLVLYLLGIGSAAIGIIFYKIFKKSFMRYV